jgi:hypothetical protein
MSTQAEPVVSKRREHWFERWFFLSILAALVTSWAIYGTIYYDRVLPFFDSVAYQESFARIVTRTGTVGVWQTFREAWVETSNVALFRLYAAIFGPLLPATNGGLYVYLLGIHFVATVLLVRTIRRSTTSMTLAVYAAAAWLASRPFGETINGVLDQRMDLASGSFCLAVTALFFDWAVKPSRWAATFAGLAAALAVLHRPVMAVTIAVIAFVFVVRSVMRHGARRRALAQDLACMVLPGLVLTLPWLIYHTHELKFYYLIWNVAVGNAHSVGEAAAYNLEMFSWSLGGVYPWMIAGVLIVGVVARRIDWLDLGALAICLLFPLSTLILSRSVGNYLVGQVALGMPALALACLRPGPLDFKLSKVGPWVALAVLLVVSVRSLYWLDRQLVGIDRTPRIEAVQFLREFDRNADVRDRVVTGFQSVPLDTSALSALARQEGIAFKPGRSFFHPVDFGIPNSAADALQADEFAAKVREVLQLIRKESTHLMVASEDTEKLLPPAHYSQVRAQSIRKMIQQDESFVLRYTSSAIAGIRFSIFEIRQPAAAP